MDKIKYSEKQIVDILHDDIISLFSASKDRLDEVNTKLTELEKLQPWNKENKAIAASLKEEFDKEYERYLKLFTVISKPLNAKEH